MEKSYDVRRYDFGCYDKHLCLKPPFWLMTSIVFLCRDFLLPLVVAAASMKVGSIDMKWWVSAIRQPYWCLTGLPALLVLYALLRRNPSSDLFARWIWRRGTLLLTLSALTGVYPVVPLVSTRFTAGDGLTPLSMAILNACVLSYILISKRAKDAFLDFPDVSKNV